MTVLPEGFGEMGSITNVPDGVVVESLGPSPAMHDLLMEALRVVALPPEQTHCKGDEDCTHSVVRKMLAYLSFPAYITRREEKKETS